MVANERLTTESMALLASPDEVATFEPRRGDGWIRAAVILGFFVLYLLNCGSFGLWDPWETHYGEVSRNMLESYDWLNPWWGYRAKIGTEAVAGNWFYSKPIYIFWSEVSFLKLIGLSDWAFRLPVALLGASMVSAVYLTIERIFSRDDAVLSALVVGLSPFIYMVSRQAQTDIPFVATMTIGLCFFLMAVFGKRQRLTSAGFVVAVLSFVLFTLLNLVPQWAIIATDLADSNAGSQLEGLRALGLQIQYNGIYHVLIYLPFALAVLASVLWPIWRRRGHADGWDDAFKDRQMRRMYLLCFYMMLAQATYAKGLLGFMLPGAMIFVFLLVSGRWWLLARVELVRGIALFLLTGLPWYVAMFCRHGRAYYNRFFIHDHFNRVGSGVHQIDSGTFEHYIKWLGFGLFPWSIFIPMALIAFAHRQWAERRLALASPDGGVRVFLLSWFVVTFTLFTASSTKFHHYVLPAVPAIAILVALYLRDLPGLSSSRLRLQGLLALGFFAVLVVNLLDDAQNLRNLFTYKYDRPLPENLPIDWNAAIHWSRDSHPIIRWSDSHFGQHVGGMVAHLLEVRWFRYDTFVKVIAALGGAGLLLMLFRRGRVWGLTTVAITATLLAFWALNYYMPTLTPHWSQRYLFEAYYEDCTTHPNADAIEEAYKPLIRRARLDGLADFFDSQPKRVCKEDIISWLITWRGETYYSNNEIRPINKEAKQFAPYLRDFNKGQPFYVLMERGRTNGFAGKLRRASEKLRGQSVEGWLNIKDWKVDLISNESAYFVVGKAVPVFEGDAEPAK